MIKLTSVQIKLAEQLLLSVKNHEMSVEYNELAERIVPPIHWRQVGKNIGEVSKLCHELGLPLISAKVVNKNTQKAGEGFYPLYKALFLRSLCFFHDVFLFLGDGDKETAVKPQRGWKKKRPPQQPPQKTA